MESGWGKKYLCTEILRTGYSRLQLPRRAGGEPPVRVNHLPRGVGSPLNGQKKYRGIRAQGRQGLLSDLYFRWSSTDIDNSKKEDKADEDQALWAQQWHGMYLFILSLEHIHLFLLEGYSDLWIQVFCVTGLHPPHLSSSTNSPYPQ